MAVLKGRLVDDRGRALPSGTVYFLAGPVALPDVAQVTAADGTFVLTAPVPGRYRVGGRAPGFAPGEAEIVVSGDEAHLEVQLVRAGRGV